MTRLATDLLRTFATTRLFASWLAANCNRCDEKLVCILYKALLAEWMQHGKISRQNYDDTGAGEDSLKEAAMCKEADRQYKRRYPLRDANCHLCEHKDPVRCQVACWYSAHPEDLPPPALFDANNPASYHEPAAPRTNDPPQGTSTEPPAGSASR